MLHHQRRGIEMGAIFLSVSNEGGIMKLLTSYQLGPLTLANRMVMAPMTRSRSPQNNAPTDVNALYYAQRASAGLIVTEAAQVSAQGVGYPWTPGVHTPEQVEGWKRVTEAVHKAGGYIFAQLFHGGRISHPDYHGGELPVSPSAVKPEGQVFTYEGMQDFVAPRALDKAEIPDIMEDFARATECARNAGFDGVEIHAANGYLPNQFLCDGTNQRTDDYGGSVENRSRFVLELTQAVVGEWASDHVGIRLSPSGLFNSMSHSDPVATFDYLVGKLDGYNLAYLHLIEPGMPLDEFPQYLKTVTPHYRKLYSGTLITCGGYDRKKGELALAEVTTDLVAFGGLFLANPDLPARFETNADLNVPDEATFYGGDEKGYSDYPFLAS